MTMPRRRRHSSGFKWVALACVLLTGIYFSKGFLQRLQKPVHPPNAFYQVKRGDLLISITEDGALRALNETIVRNGLEGVNRIIHLVPEGSYVQKDDLLVELDSSGLKDRLNEQEVQYQERLFQVLQAEGNLKIQKSLAESQIKDGELKLENAQGDLEKYRDGDAPLVIKTVEARSGVLGEQVRIASERYTRTQELFKKGQATRSELEADALSMKREQLALEQYQEDLRLIKKYDQPNQIRMLQSKVEQAKAELNRLKQRTSNEIAQADADLKTGQAALEFLQEDIEMQRKRLENTKIYAPQNGLVVYASVSPFQYASRDEGRRDEGRFRGSRGGRGGDEFSGMFRGGRGRGGRSSLEGSSGSSGPASSTAETVAAGNQRIASAISGSSVNEPNAGGSGGSGGSGASPGGGGRSGGSSGGGGGQNASSAAGVFASYPSMRPSSLFGASSVSNSNGGSAGAGGNGAGSSGSSSMLSTGGQNSSFNNGNQSSFQLRRQSYDFGGYDFYGTPGILEEGLMVRQRQELIRLPDVSKMLAEIKIEEARVRQVKAGMTAFIEIHNLPHRRFKGTVRRVAFMPDAQSSWMNPNVKLFPTDVMVDEELPILKPGVSARVEIIITNLTKVLSVPIQTVARLEGENVCWVKRGSRVTPVTVTTGLFNDTFVEVTSGLKEGDLVLLAAVGDEEIEDTPPSGSTNQVETPTDTPRSRSQPMEELQGQGSERRFQRREGDPGMGDAPPGERRRGRGADIGRGEAGRGEVGRGSRRASSSENRPAGNPSEGPE